MTKLPRFTFHLAAALILGAAATGASGCTVTSSSSCSLDSTVVCATGDGWSCSGSDTPWDSNSNLSCSDGVVDSSGNTDYCCFDFGGSSSTCTPDDTLSCPTAGSYGYTCVAGDDPTSLDSSLVCSDPTPDGNYDTFCCQ
jgi:hypothetical protein